MKRLRGGGERPSEGAYAAFFGILMRYPEVLAWDYQYRLSREEVMKGMYDTIKKIYPGVGFNLPGGGPDDPEVIYQCVKRSFEAGAAGVVASREYEEMTVPNPKGFGRGVREAAAARPR